MTDIQKSQLIKATKDHYATIENMSRFYAYDMSRTCGFIRDWDWSFPANGLYEGCGIKRYFEEQNCHAFLIKVADELAGFVLIHPKGTHPETDWSMGEFFIVAKFQGKGIGKQIADEVWQLFPGKWEVTVIPENIPALGFWQKCIHAHTRGHYQNELRNSYPNKLQPLRHVFHFTTHAKATS